MGERAGILARNGGYRSAVILLRRGDPPREVEEWLMRTHCIKDRKCAISVVRAALAGIASADKLLADGGTVTAVSPPDIGGRI